MSNTHTPPILCSRRPGVQHRRAPQCPPRTESPPLRSPPPQNKPSPQRRRHAVQPPPELQSQRGRDDPQTQFSTSRRRSRSASGLVRVKGAAAKQPPCQRAVSVQQCSISSHSISSHSCHRAVTATQSSAASTASGTARTQSEGQASPNLPCLCMRVCVCVSVVCPLSSCTACCALAVRCG